MVDYEHHEHEWGSRLRGLGASADERAHFHYRSPFASDWEAKRGSLLDVAESLRSEAELIGAHRIVVDSYVLATSTGDSMGGQAGAQDYFKALAVIGLPSITLAHVTGNADRFPDKPFGSVFVHNFARETWAMEQKAQNDGPVDRLVDALTSTIHVELRNKKSNGRARAVPYFMDISFGANGDIDVSPVNRRLNISELVDAVLRATPGLAVAAIVKAILEDTGEKVKPEAVTDVLRKTADRYVHSSTRPFKWSLS
jgi:hypothetical protein